MDSSAISYVDWPSTLPTPLQARKHTIEPRSEGMTMESKRIRVRRLYLESIEVMDVTWHFTEDQFEEFQDWFVNEIGSGVDRFTMETLEPVDIPPNTPGSYNRVVRTLGFLGEPPYKFARSDNLFAVSASLEIDQEDTFLVNPPEPPEPEHPMDPPPVVTYPDVVCKDEVQIDLPTIAGLTNVVIEFKPTPSSPWTFWGETRQGVSTLTVGNYFAGKRFRIKAQTLDTTFVSSSMLLDPPAVAPPIVTVELGNHHYDPDTDSFVTDYTPADLATRPLIYAATSALDAERVIAAVGTTNKTDPATSRQNYSLNLFSTALVEVGPRYSIPVPGDGSYGRVRITCTTEQEGEVAFQITLDGTDPTEENGFTSPAEDIVVSHYYPYAICRAFKDGCKSPPIYIPLDGKTEDVAFDRHCNVGTGSASCQCRTWQYVETAPMSGICNLQHYTMVGEPCNEAATSPCPKPANLETLAFTDAPTHGGTNTNPSGNKILAGILTTPGTFFSGGEYFYFGPDPNECPSGPWGGGYWVCIADVVWLDHYALTSYYSASWGFRPADALFTLMEMDMTQDGAPVTLPASGDERPLVTGLLGPDGDTENDASAVLLDLTPGLAQSPPAGEVLWTLEGVTITVTCCNS